MGAGKPVRPALSAAAARALIELDPPREELVRLALKELVVRGAWRLDRAPATLLRRAAPLFVPGHARAGLPAPLPLVDAALRADVPAAGLALRVVVRRLRRRRPRLAADVERAAHGVLVEHRLVEERRGRALRVLPRTVRSRTASGDALATEVRLALGRRDPEELGVLALLLVPDALGDLRTADRKLRRAETEAALRTADEETFRDLDAVMDGTFDVVFDGGGGGGGGDGGGGGT